MFGNLCLDICLEICLDICSNIILFFLNYVLENHLVPLDKWECSLNFGIVIHLEMNHMFLSQVFLS